MARETSETCTWPAGCEEVHADDSRYCAHHRDVKKRSNENQRRKREGLPPLPENGTPERKKREHHAQGARPKSEQAEVRIISRAHPVPASAATEMPAGVHWGEWKVSLLAQMDQAIGQLDEQLTKTKAARDAVEVL